MRGNKTKQTSTTRKGGRPESVLLLSLNKK
jgi:hypothetical protein